jgi:hypothetical protein
MSLRGADMRLPLGIFLIMLLKANWATAQFAGDIFFVTPSVVAVKGNVANLDLASFTGTTPFGAIQGQVGFDATKLELVSITAITTGKVTPFVQWKRTGGAIKFVVINASSLTLPFGTVPLLRLQFKATGNVGDRIAITTGIVSLLFANRTTMPTGTGRSGEIVIAASALRTAESLIGSETSPNFEFTTDESLRSRALTMRPAGYQVRIVTVDKNGLPHEDLVRTTDSVADRE